MTIQSQNPYLGPQQFPPQQQSMGLGAMPAHLAGQHHAAPYATGAQFTGQQFGQQYPVLPGYQPVVFQVPQQLVPELTGQGYGQYGQFGQAATPVLPIAYAPIIAAGAGQQIMPTPWAGQQLPWAGQPQFGGMLPFGQVSQQFGQQPFAPQQFQQYGQRPTLW